MLSKLQAILQYDSHPLHNALVKQRSSVGQATSYSALNEASLHQSYPPEKCFPDHIYIALYIVCILGLVIEHLRLYTLLSYFIVYFTFYLYPYLYLSLFIYPQIKLNLKNLGIISIVSV